MSDEALTQDDLDSELQDLRQEFEDKFESLRSSFERDLQWLKDDLQTIKDDASNEVYDLEMKVDQQAAVINRLQTEISHLRDFAQGRSRSPF
jgi:uncharacterized phage infection (PIP) family protein YhgE